MDYNHAAYVADRRTLGFKSGFGLTTASMLKLQLMGLRDKQETDEWPKIEAALARLTAWIDSNQPLPVPPASPTPNPSNRPEQAKSNAAEPAQTGLSEVEAAALKAALAAWQVELQGRLTRHRRRRSRYPAVAPPA